MRQRAKLHFVLHGYVREVSASSPLPLFPLVSHPSWSAGMVLHGSRGGVGTAAQGQAFL